LLCFVLNVWRHWKRSGYKKVGIQIGSGQSRKQVTRVIRFAYPWLEKWSPRPSKNRGFTSRIHTIVCTYLYLLGKYLNLMIQRSQALY
jgi:hypothetical protein